MVTSRRVFLATVASTTVLAGCTGGGGQPTDTPTASPTPTEASTDSPTPTDAAGSDATVQVASHPEYDDILVDAAGMTLYVFDRDTEGDGSSVCTGDCADAWPPLTVTGEPTAGAGVTASLSTFERESGETQVAAGGWPLYYFNSDGEPGDAEGQGVGDVWWVVAPDGTPRRPETTATPTPTGGGGGDGPY